MFSMPKHCRFLCPSGTITRFPKKTLLLVFGAWQKFLAASECDAQLVLEREFATREKRL